MLKIISGILEALFQGFLEDHINVQDRLFLAGNPHTFERVRVEYQKSLLGGVRFTASFMLRVLIVCIPLFFLNDPYVLVFPLFALSLIVFMGYFAHSHYGGMSGMGRTYDIKTAIKTRMSLYVNEQGLHGQVSLPWKSIASVHSIGDTRVHIDLRKRLLLPNPSNSFTIHFQTNEDASAFVALTTSGGTAAPV